MINMSLGAVILDVQAGPNTWGDLNFSELIWGLTAFISFSSHLIDSMSLRRKYNANP